jgi:hypothetical protein
MATYSSKKYPAGSVTSAQLADGTVVAVDLADGAITSAKLNSTVDLSGKTVTYRSIVAGDIASNAITTAKISDANITPAKMSNSGAELGMRNRVINGAMSIDQRNVGVAQTWNGSNGYTLDRYFAYSSGGGGIFTTQQVTDAPTGFTHSLKATVTTADASIATGDLYFLQHKIEGYNAVDLAWGTASAQPVTISFWVKSSLTGSFPFTIIDAAGGANYSSYGVLYTISSANTWEYKSFTIPGPTTGTWNKTNGVGMQLSIGLGGGTQYTMAANSWTANKEAYQVTGNVNLISTLNATWQITGLQLEKGSTATPFEHRPFGTELALCQRYYEQIVQGSSAPQNLFLSGVLIGGNCTHTAYFKVTKRTAPSWAAINGATWTNTPNNSNTSTDCVIFQNTTSGYFYLGTAAGQGAGFSAEL